MTSRPARPASRTVDLEELDRRVLELTAASARRQRRRPAAGAGRDVGGTVPQTSPAADAVATPGGLERVSDLLVGLREDVVGMRSAFLELPSVEELDGRMAALEARMAAVDAALATAVERLEKLTRAVVSLRPPVQQRPPRAAATRR